MRTWLGIVAAAPCLAADLFSQALQTWQMRTELPLVMIRLTECLEDTHPKVSSADCGLREVRLFDGWLLAISRDFRFGRRARRRWKRCFEQSLLLSC